jgi:hypothetical protein
MAISPDVVYAENGVPLICQQFFERYRELHGSPPGRNAMMRAAELAVISEHQIRLSWEILTGRRRAAPRRYRPYRKGEILVEAPNGQQEAEVQDSEVTEAEDEVTSLAIGLVKQQKRITVLEQTVRELRELLMQVPTKALPMPGEVVTAVGRLQADGARTATNVQRLSDRLDVSDRRMNAIDAATRPWQEFWQRLCESEDAWESWLSMLRACSHHTKKTLLAFFAASTGHELSHNDKVPQ